MRIALVGTGTISETMHIPIIKSSTDIEIVGICDSNQKQLSRVADKFKIQNRFTDATEMLRSTDIDILDITTPGFTHFGIAKKAISMGVNVLVEKPATLSSEQASYLDRESERRGLKIGVCQNFRYREPVIELQRMREKGTIGNIQRIVTMHHGSTVFAQPPWFWDENKSGGILFELGIHVIDLNCYLMGPAKEVISVTRHYDEELKFTTAILAVVQFETGIGVIDFKWFSSSNFVHQYISGSVADAILKFYPDGFILQQAEFAPLGEFVGEAKRLWGFGYSALRKRYLERSQLSHRIIIEDFVKSVQSDKKPLVPVSSVISSIRLVEDIQSKAGMQRISVQD